MTQQFTGGDNVQILAPFGASVCALCDQPTGTQVMMAQSKTVMATVDSTILSNNEMDMQAVDGMNTIGGIPIEHNFALQCEQSAPASNPGYWAIDGSGKWITTGISDHCPWPANTPLQVVAQGWWALGDTGCGGNGCFHVMSFTVNGTVHDLSGTVWQSGFPAGTLAQPGQPGWSSFFGLQDQMDLAVGGGTAGRTVSNANVTVAYYTPNPVTASATYNLAPSAIVSPNPGSTLPAANATFAWSAAPGATGYRLRLGTTPGGNDVYSTGSITATSATATKLPTNGTTIYATLYTVYGSVQVNSVSTFTAGSAAALTTPAAGTVLAGPNVTFNWAPAAGATGYALRLGTSLGGNNLWSSGPITATSATPKGLPTNGETVYARLYTNYGSVQVYTDYSFTAATQASLTSPAGGTTLAGPSVTFNRATAAGATGYALRFGTTVGGNNLWSSGPITATTATAKGLPTDGETVYARLYTYYGSITAYADYLFTAATPTGLTAPLPGTVLAGPSVTFNWTAATGATGYAIRFGTTEGGKNIWSSGPITATSATAKGLPTNGATVYARLYTTYGSSQVYTDYTFTAATQSALTSPTGGTSLTGPSVAFNWTTAIGATGYALRLGTTAGGNNLWSSGQITATSATAKGLPTNGATVYARLFTYYGSTAVYTDYSFTAYTAP